ncbi:MAG: phosphonatase-like hydrolase [Bacteroidota bacterium]
MIKMVVFDMAGTTVDEDNVVYKTLCKTINAAGGVHCTLEQVLHIGAGKEKLAAIKDILAAHGIEMNYSLAQEIYQSFVTELAIAYDSFELKPQPGAEDMFRTLHTRNIAVVLNTGYNAATANSILQKLGWQTGAQIDALVTASDVVNNRPQPDMILLAMQQFGISDASEVVKVGDSAIDIEEGQNAGCGLTVGVTTGAHSFEQLLAANPDYIIESLEALNALIP